LKLQTNQIRFSHVYLKAEQNPLQNNSQRVSMDHINCRLYASNPV